MKRSGIITIDIGTTSMRAILYDREGRQLAMSRRDNQPEYFQDGRVEQDAGTWESILAQVLSDSAKAAEAHDIQPEGISLTAARSSVIPVDPEGKALHPAIMWQDLRTEAMCRELSVHDPEVYGICGMRVTPVMSAVKMKWFREKRPDIHARTWKMVGIHDFVLALLTGRYVTDPSLASRTNLLNLETLDWDGRLMELFGVPRGMLCDMIPTGSLAGGLLPGLAARTGLPAGLPVVNAGGDQQCAALGLGLISEDRIVANTGTGSYLIAFSRKPVFDPGMRVFCNAGAVQGSYVVEAGIPASGVVYRWFGEQLYDDAVAKACACGDFSALNEEAAASPPGAKGLIFLPHFKGSGAPWFNPNAKGTLHNLDLDSTRGDMARAMLEGIAAELADNLEILESLAGKVARVNASGGLTRFDLFNHIQADMYGRTLRKAEHGEATALGAWISAAVRLGIHAGHAEALAAAEGGAEMEEIPTDSAIHELYTGLRERRRELYRSIYQRGNR
jgi:sugar (pentulose or hexulose) kinase